MTTEVDPRLVALGLAPAPPPLPDATPAAPAGAPAAEPSRTVAAASLPSFTPAPMPKLGPLPTLTPAAAPKLTPAAAPKLKPGTAPKLKAGTAPKLKPLLLPTARVAAPPAPASAPPTEAAPAPDAAALSSAERLSVLPPLATPARDETAPAKTKAAKPKAAKAAKTKAAMPSLATPKAEMPKVAVPKLALPALPLPKVARKAKAPPPPKPYFGGNELQADAVVGFPPQRAELTFDAHELYLSGPRAATAKWADVRTIAAARGVVTLTLAKDSIAFTPALAGVAEPTIVPSVVRVLGNAKNGDIDRYGSAYVELQNARDRLRDIFQDADDPMTLVIVGCVVAVATAVAALTYPGILSMLTATIPPPGQFVIDSRLASWDPRIVLAAFATAGMLACAAARLALGVHAVTWARGTLRGWHKSGTKQDDLARRGIALMVLRPGLSAGLLLLAIVLSLPSARTQVIVDAAGVHLIREIPFFDDHRPWENVTDISTVPAERPSGVGVVMRLSDQTITSGDRILRGGTDRQLYEQAVKWRSAVFRER